MRKLIILAASVAALAVPTAAMASPASAASGKAKFTGSASIASDGQLVVSFTEKGFGKAKVKGVGKPQVSYRLQASADARYACDGVWLGDSASFGGPSWNSPSQNATLTPAKDRTSGSLSHPVVSITSLIFSPCPNNGIRTLYSITWSQITVTSSTGQVLVLNAVAYP